MTTHPFAKTYLSFRVLLSSRSRSASAPISITPFAGSLRMLAGLRVMRGRIFSSGHCCSKYMFHRNLSMDLGLATPYLVSLPLSSLEDSDPYESVEMHTRSIGTPSSSKRLTAATTLTWLKHVKSAYPPSLTQAAPSSMRASERSRCVGRKVVMGTSDSSTAVRRGDSIPALSPMWQYMMPALPLSIPPTLASTAASMIVCVVGCEPLWSEMEHSPTPMHCSIRQTSRRIEPVRVGAGRRYAPVHM
mmetsp:Transcript_26079/g.66361  ORF Transcript_26079/g.66361 Transcript_26079/m.66361 type:complete len:246 (-) Transcript_26079:5717-6454(-)